MLEETLAGSNTDAVKTTLTGLHNFKIALPIFQDTEKRLATPQSHLVTCGREYYKRLSRLKRHIQIGRFSSLNSSGFVACLVTQSVI